MVFSRTALLLEQTDDGLCTVILHNADGNDTRLPAVTPTEDLINATEIDYREYRSELKHLREEHPLFEPRLDVSVTDFEDFVAKATARCSSASSCVTVCMPACCDIQTLHRTPAPT